MSWWEFRGFWGFCKGLSLQFSVVLLGSYAAGFAALRLAKSVGYADAYWAAVGLAVLAGGLLYACKSLFDSDEP